MIKCNDKQQPEPTQPPLGMNRCGDGIACGGGQTTRAVNCNVDGRAKLGDSCGPCYGNDCGGNKCCEPSLICQGGYYGEDEYGKELSIPGTCKQPTKQSDCGEGPGWNYSKKTGYCVEEPCSLCAPGSPSPGKKYVADCLNAYQKESPGNPPTVNKLELGDAFCAIETADSPTTYPTTCCVCKKYPCVGCLLDGADPNPYGKAITCDMFCMRKDKKYIGGVCNNPDITSTDPTRCCKCFEKGQWGEVSGTPA